MDVAVSCSATRDSTQTNTSGVCRASGVNASHTFTVVVLVGRSEVTDWKNSMVAVEEAVAEGGQSPILDLKKGKTIGTYVLQLSRWCGTLNTPTIPR